MITFAKPEKNAFPVERSEIELSSSKLAPAQKVLSPDDFKILTFFPLSILKPTLEDFLDFES